MSHQHDAIYTDEETSATIGSHQIPIPMNWKVLVQPNQVKMTTAGGILLPDTSKDNEEYLTAHGTVCAMGDLAYRDRDTGERWKSGQKIVVKGVKFLLLNDDELTSILPEGVEVAAYLG